MDERKDVIETQLLSYIKEAESEYGDLEEKAKQIHRRLAELSGTIQNLKETLEFHLAKAGGEDREETSEFAEIDRAREAVHIALQKYGDMDKEQLKDRLLKGGFNFRGKKPVPVIHFAMVGNPKVTITEEGKYQWIGNGKPRVAILSVPKGVIRFFIENDNKPASLSEVLEGIKKLGVRTTAKDLEGNVEMELMYNDNMERTGEDEYRLKQDVFETIKELEK